MGAANAMASRTMWLALEPPDLAFALSPLRRSRRLRVKI
jgi:hypothetical protein